MTNIRAANNNDLKKLAIIYKEAYNTLKIGENWDDKSAESLLVHFFEEQPDLFFVAELDNEVAGGIVSLVKPWWDGYHLTDGEIFVSPEFQAKGIGFELIRHMFVVAKDKYNAISWDTFTHRVYDHPLHWYKKIGFTEIKEWTMISGDVDEVLANLEKEQ